MSGLRYEGRVAKIPEAREGMGKRGKWFSYSFALEGRPKDVWYNLGFNKKPTFQEGDFVQFTAEENANGYLTVVGEVTRAKNAPARNNAGAGAAEGTSDVGRQSSAVKGTNDTSPVVSGSDGADRQTQIVLQHSQEIATRVIDLLLRNDALPMSEAKSKAGNAKRFDEILASVDKLTVKYFKDVVSARLLSSVVDMGVVSVKADGAIPDVQTAAKRGPGRPKAAVAPETDDLAVQNDDDGPPFDEDEENFQ